MTISEILTVAFQIAGLVGAALTLAYYGGQWTRSIKSIETTVTELRDDIKGIANTQQAHGERIAGIEARQAVQR